VIERAASYRRFVAQLAVPFVFSSNLRPSAQSADQPLFFVFLAFLPWRPWRLGVLAFIIHFVVQTMGGVRRVSVSSAAGSFAGRGAHA
jgi:hypothetical protein